MFWGVEVKPGEPYILTSSSRGGRLRITQATLGDEVCKVGEGRKSVVRLQCTVDNMKPVFFCALIPEQHESCQLDFEFQEGNVVFSAVGTMSVHLAGYFVGCQYRDQDEDSSSNGDDSDSAGAQVDMEEIHNDLKSGNTTSSTIQTTETDDFLRHHDGFQIREIRMGKLNRDDEEGASIGNKVYVKYNLMREEDGRIIAHTPAEKHISFRLGDNNMEVLNSGMRGMHVGDGRRLIIPPSMVNMIGLANLPQETLLWDVFLYDLDRE